MDTASRTASRPPMPDADRVVTRSARYLVARGMTRAQALDTIAAAAAAANEVLKKAGIFDTWWLTAIYVNASDRRVAHPSPTSESEALRHGDETGGPSQRPEDGPPAGQAG